MIKPIKKTYKWFQSMIVDFSLFALSKNEKRTAQVQESLVKLQKGLAQEGRETKEMLDIYQRYTQGSASKEEMKKANEQFVDIVKGMGLGVLLVLPFAPLTLPFIVKLGQKLGIEILPSSFRSEE